MTICFKLSMPNVASWNGRWSGEGKLYAVVRSVGRSPDAQSKAAAIIGKRHFYYRWSDGWGASIEAIEVDRNEAAKIRRKSAGFCGYQWMVDSILNHGAIYASHEEIPSNTAR